MGISERTVRYHVSQALSVLGARSRAQAVAVALSNGEIAKVRRIAHI